MLEAEDVAIMMILLKIARIQTGTFKPDNYIDIAGYAACAAPAPMAADQQEDKAEVMAGLKKKCDPAPKTGARRKALDDGKIRALRKAGWTLEKIADEMGCAPQTIKNRLDEYKAESAT